MKDYYYTYKNQLKLDDPFDNENSLIHSSKDIVSDNFDDFMFNDSVTIDGTSTKVVLKQEKNSSDKKVIFSPDTRINIGSVVNVGNLNYLTVDFLGDGVYSIFPTATLKLCNSTFPIESNKTKVLIGYNEFGEEMWETTDGETILLPCIVEYTTQSTSTTEAINLPEGQINITIQFTENDSIAEGKEFTMYNTKYQIIGIDYTKSINKVGLITIKGKKVQ